VTQQQFSDADLAYHEAGHAVAALALGQTVARVSIMREDASRGVQVPSFNAEDSAAVRDKVLILLAGCAAQQVRDPTSPRRQDAKDWPRAEALIGDTAALEAEWDRAMALLQTPEHWQQVDRIAQALLRERILEREQILRLMGRAP
jgi:hypothetical protein